MIIGVGTPNATELGGRMQHAYESEFPGQPFGSNTVYMCHRGVTATSL